MKNFTIVDDTVLRQAVTATISLRDDPAMGLIPRFEPAIFDWADDEPGIEPARLPGIAPWDAWLKQSQLTRH